MKMGAASDRLAEKVGSFVSSLVEPKASGEWAHETSSAAQQSDWTRLLAPDAVALLRSVLESAYGHRQAYFKAGDVKNAQLWSAVLELKREINEVNERLDRLSPRERKSVGLAREGPDLAMQRIQDAVRPAPEDSKEATDALIDSLMKF